jgi:hypothetical protein
MAISNLFEKLGRAIFEAPFAGSLTDETPELAEIRLAILDAVKAKSHRAGSHLVFPFNLVRIQLRGVPQEQAEMFQGGLLAGYLEEDLKRRLARAGHRFRGDLRVEIATTPDLPLENQTWLLVETALDRPQESPASEAPRQPAKLLVLHGTANRSTLILNKPRINIGRSAEVFRSAAPSRKNDLAFIEENEINRTVSREHAHIARNQKTGEYRIFNDRWYKGHANCGIWIVRDGLSQPVQRGARGLLLQGGDEIHLGSAILRFVAK